MRKIIQISTNVDSEGRENFYALCNDGTIWELYLCSKTWIEIDLPDELINEGPF